MKRIRKKWWIKWSFRLLIIGILSFVFLYQSVKFEYWGKMPTSFELNNLYSMEGSVIVDKDNFEIGKIALSNQKPVTLEELPPHLIHALIATEDIRFFKHKGTDFKSLFRVFFKSILRKNKSSGGGSTLTQQLVKNMFPRQANEKLSLFIHKIREDIIAREIEKIFSKEEILVLYLNTVPFSGNAYGIESAAMKFFNVSTKELDILQAATLVGTLKANHLYNPQLFPERSKNRRNVVLKQMEKYGYLSSEETRKLIQEDVVLNLYRTASKSPLAPYFNQQVKRELQDILDQKKYYKLDGTPYDLVKDGLTIVTTLDSKMQKYADSAMQEHLTELQKQFELSYGTNSPWDFNTATMQIAIRNLPVYRKLKMKGYSDETIADSLKIKKETLLFGWEKDTVKMVSVLDSLQHFIKFLNTGMVALDPHSGEIRAYIGGIDYHFFQFDHVNQSKRQVGSIFKPFVYAAAIENGIAPCSYFSTKTITYVDQGRWTPRNSGGGETAARYSMSAALAYSLNTVAVKIIREVGVENVIQLVEKMGIEEEIGNNPSIALGVSAIRLVEMAAAFSCFLNDGKSISPHSISKILDRNGKVIYNYPKQEPKKVVLSKETREIMVEMMKGVVNYGTGKRLRTKYKIKNDIAGKTGTTQNNADGWFVGLLPDLVTVTWVGNDNPAIRFKSTGIGQGANSALPIFAKMIQKMNNDGSFDELTQAKFPDLSPELVLKMDCPQTKMPSFADQFIKHEEKQQNFDKTKDKKPSFNYIFR